MAKGRLMRWTAFALVIAGCLVLGGCGGDGSPAPVAGGAPAPSGPAGAPGMPGEGTPPDGGTPPGDGNTQPSDGAQAGLPGGDYTPPPDGGQPGLPGDGYVPPGDTPGYNPDGTPMTLPPRVKSLRERAIDAFRAGDETEGFRLLRTQLAISPGAQADVAEKVAWVPGLRRPAIGPRIGIAAHYVTAVGEFKDSPQPIGSSELKTALDAVAPSTGRGGQRAGAGSEASAGAGIAPGQPGGDPAKAAEGQLEFYTGEFGTKLLAGLKSRIESGEYGLIYKDLAEEVARPAPTFDPNNPGDPNQFPGGLPGGEVHPGTAFVNPGDGTPVSESAAGPGRLCMAVTWLGKADKRDELIKLAHEAGVDLLVTYEIALKSTRVQNLINNQTRIKITDLKKADTILFTSPALENRTVIQAREKGQKGDDPVDKEVGRALEALDKVCKPTPLPDGVTAERAKARIAGLIAEKPADPLPVLLEARFYVAKGLMTESEMQSAAVSLLGQAEYAQLIASSPDGALNQMIGEAIGLPGMIDLMRGVNTATGASARAQARKRGEPNPGESGQPKARGWRDFLPVGGKKQ